jgi:hypothetical protein
MAKHKPKDRDDAKAKKHAGERGTAGNLGTADAAAGGQHHAARAHGQASRVDTSLPATREELLVLHAEARRRRNAAALGSADFRAAVEAIERIEIRVAAIEQAPDPPLA